MEVLDDVTAEMVWRITASNVDAFGVPRPVTKEGVVEAYGKAKKKMLPGQPKSGRPSHLMLLAEANRRGLGVPTNWPRSKALFRLFESELGFNWDDPADRGVPSADSIAAVAEAADPPNFRHKFCGVRVINYVSVNAHGYRVWKAGDETREDQDATRAMAPVARVEEGYWGQCAKAIMETSENADIDRLQVGEGGDDLFDDLDPSVQAPPCMAGLALNLAAAKCKKFALQVAANVSAKIQNMCQSGMGNLPRRMQQCMSTGSTLAFPALGDAELDTDGMRATGSAPSDFIKSQIEMYWYQMVVKTDILMASVRLMPTDAQAGGEQGSCTQLRTPRSGGTPGTTPRTGNTRRGGSSSSKKRKQGKGVLSRSGRPRHDPRDQSVNVLSSDGCSGSDSEAGGAWRQAITDAARAVQGKQRAPGTANTDEMIAARARVSDLACRTREAEAQTAELQNIRVHEEEFERRVSQLEDMVKANASALRVGMAAKRVCTVGARTENTPADIRALVCEVVKDSDTYAALAVEYA